jgi:hypothetical protein
MSPSMNNKLSRRAYLMVILLWIIFQAAWYLYLGVEFGLESAKYIDQAQYFLEHGQFSQFRYIFYCTTIFVIVLAKILNLGLYGALFIIMAMNLLSYLFFFQALRTFFNHHIPALLVVALLMSFWPFQSWSLYLFTECLFYSLVMVLTGHLLLFKKLNFRFVFTGLVLLLLLMISRPLGILFVLPFMVFVFFKLSRKQRLYFFLSGVLFLLLLNFVVQVVFTTTSDWNMTRALTEDSIICDMPRADARSQLNLTQHPNQFYQLFYYVTHNFSHFAGLALIRLKYFFLMVRDYYSTFHNVYMIGYLTVFYGSLIWGFRRIHRSLSRSTGWFMSTSVFLFAATIALQCDDYHNRFFLTLTPFFAFTTITAWWPVLQRLSFFAGRRKD